MEQQNEAYRGWAILELMGHRKLGGAVSQVEQYGTAMVRIDVPAVDGHDSFTQFYGGTAIYCVTPTTEAIAREIAESARLIPVDKFEMRQLPCDPEDPGF